MALLCSTDVAPGSYTKRLFTSDDTARTSTERGTAPAVDQPQGLAATGQVVAITGVGGSSVVQRSADRGRTWATPFTADPAAMDDLQLRGSTGVVVRGSATFEGAPGQLLLSSDGGRHWGVAAVRVPSAAGSTG